MRISKCVPKIIRGLNINYSNQVNHEIIYNLTRVLCYDDWERIVDPKAMVRYYIQKNVKGYKISRLL
jgi:hypothetical protein